MSIESATEVFHAFNRIPVRGRRIPLGRIPAEQLNPEQARQALADMEQIARDAGFRSLRSLLRMPAAVRKPGDATMGFHWHAYRSWQWTVDQLRAVVGKPAIWEKPYVQKPRAVQQARRAA